MYSSFLRLAAIWMLASSTSRYRQVELFPFLLQLLARFLHRYYCPRTQQTLESQHRRRVTGISRFWTRIIATPGSEDKRDTQICSDFRTEIFGGGRI